MINLELCLLPNYANKKGIQSIGNYSKNQLKKYCPKLSVYIEQLNINPQLPLKFPIDLLNHLDFIPQLSHSLLSKIQVIFEDDNFFVVNIPSKLHSSSLYYSQEDTIFNYLRITQKQDVLGVNKFSRNRGLLNRLDYLTSGILIFCKKEDLYFLLRENYAKAVTKKIYFCILKGNLCTENTLENYLEGFGPNQHKVRVCENSTGIYAKLNYSIIEYNSHKDVTLVKVFLHTGVRHQIRVQFSHIGHPLLGDPLYGKDSSLGEFFLHAQEYNVDYSHLIRSGKSYCFSTPLPDWVKNFTL